MNRFFFDTLVIIFFALVLAILAYFNLLRNLAPYASIPILMAYYLGKYVVRKYKS